MHEQKTSNSDQEKAVAPELMDNRVIGHKTVTTQNLVENQNQSEDISNTESKTQQKPDTQDTPEASNDLDIRKIEMKSPTPLDSNATLDTNRSSNGSTDGSTDESTIELTNKPKKVEESIKKSSFKNWLFKHRIVIGIIAAVILFIITIASVIGFYTYTVAMQLQDQAREAAFTARFTLDQFKAQNLPATEASLSDLKESVNEIETTYQKLAFMSYIPFANNYYADGTNGIIAAQAGVDAGVKAITAITPYADVLGFTAEDEVDPAAATAENRVKLLLETLTIIMPTLDEINEDLTVASNALNEIDPDRYPEEFRGIQVRSQLIEANQTLADAQTLLQDYRPIIEHLPAIAGSDGERKKYLVLFQNDNELRPTGGFLTAYSVIFVENGVVTPEKSDDIYELDKKFTKRLPIPEALGRYLTTERYFNLRDMNISPDFRESMDLFFENYQTVRGEPDNIDGIITVDTHLLTGLLKAVGPVEVPGYGTFSAENDPRCDCPQIIYALSEIITRPTPYIREDRKGILAPLMQALLTKIYSSPRTFMADLFEVGLDSIEGRHVQMYFLNEEHQLAAEKIHAAGALESETPEGDFLAVVNANLGGAKSNLFVTYEAKQMVEGPVDGKITKTVELTYRNPRRADNCNLEAGLLCLNSTLRDWTRIYVPAGSELISAEGFTTEPTVYEEQGFQVFDGFFILEPLGQARLRLTYTVPYDSPEYDLTVWKQGGTDPIQHLIDVNGGQELVTVGGDTVVNMPF